MLKKTIECKGGTFTVSTIYLYHAQPEVIQKALENKISQAPLLLKNAPVVINVSFISSQFNWEKIKYAIMSTGLRIIGVSGCKDEYLKCIIIKTGLPVFNEVRKKKYQDVNFIFKSKIINVPIRSGQQVYAKNQDLIVLNNVSAGAELVSDGNIHIYGKMHGRALAGANGDQNCQIFCTYLSSELVSISGEYWTMDEIPLEFNKKPVRLFLKDGILRIKNLI